jgi:hypothetical protein
MKPNTIIAAVILILFGTGLLALGQDETVNKKKFSFEVSLGIGRADPRVIYQRGSGIDALIDQYASNYQLSYSFTGKFKESKLFTPLSITVNYRLKEKLYLEAGVNYSANSTTSNKNFLVSWENFSETHDYYLKNRISYIMPHLGAGYQTKRLDLYGALGIAFTSYTHIDTLDYSEPGYGHEVEETIKATGSGLGLIIGIRYWLSLRRVIKSKRLKPFIKLEALLLTVSSLEGSKERIAASSTGERDSETIEGTLYQYNWNPYGLQSFEYWDILAAQPTDPSISGLKKMSLNLTTIRLMLGIRF